MARNFDELKVPSVKCDLNDKDNCFENMQQCKRQKIIYFMDIQLYNAMLTMSDGPQTSTPTFRLNASIIPGKRIMVVVLTWTYQTYCATCRNLPFQHEIRLQQ